MVGWLRRVLPRLRVCPSIEINNVISNAASKFSVWRAIAFNAPATQRDLAQPQVCGRFLRREKSALG
jgi:hypothetical protein